MIIESGYECGYQLTREKNHEAVITYEYYQTEKVNWYAEKELWDGLKSIGLVKKTQNRSLKRIRKSISRNVEKETVEIFKILRNFDTSTIWQSSEIINKDLCKTIVFDSRLRSADYGMLEGRYIPEISKEEWEIYNSTPETFMAESVESIFYELKFFSMNNFRKMKMY